MKKLLFILLMMATQFASAIDVSDFFPNKESLRYFPSKPLYVYPDGTSLLARYYSPINNSSNIQVCVLLRDAEGNFTIGGLEGKSEDLLKDSLMSAEYKTFPFDFYHAIKFDSVGHVLDNVVFSISLANFDKHLSSSILCGNKIWYRRKNPGSYQFSPNGTGTWKYTLVEPGFAQQAMSGNAVGSNQYQTRHKQYGATGGITGGYSFEIRTEVTQKIKWSIIGDTLRVTTTEDKPTFTPFTIATSMDNDNYQKTPRMSAKQWVRVDIKYNYDVDQAKTNLLNRINKQKANRCDVINAFTEDFLIVNHDTYEERWGTIGTDPEFKFMSDYALTKESGKAYESFKEVLISYLSFKNNLQISEYEEYVLNYFEPLKQIKKGKYQQDYNSWNRPNGWYKLENWHKLHTKAGRVGNVTAEDLANSNISQLINIVSAEIVSYQVFNGLVQFECKITTAPSKKVTETYLTDLVVYSSNSKLVVDWDRSFTYMKKVE